MARGTTRLFSVLFLLSGAAGLIYEVAWTRLLRLPMGNTVYSMTAVLTAFMAGLALGAYLAGRWIDHKGHPLRVYALLEAAIGFFCLALPWIVAAEQPLFQWAYQNLRTSIVVFNLIKFFATGLVILIPATLMGATLPVLCRFFVDRPERFGLSLGWLYAINAFGAAIGSLLSGFVLIPALGVQGAIYFGVGVSWTVALIAWLAQSRTPFEPARQVVDQTRSQHPRAVVRSTLRMVLLAGYGLSGLAAMAFQIAWARIIAMVLGSSVYAFALLVSAFILGLALGSQLVSRFVDRLRNPSLGFAIAQIGIGVTALAVIPVLQHFPDWMLQIVPGVSQRFALFQLVQFGLIFVVVLLPTAFMGACLPLVGRALVHGMEDVGKAVGSAYSSNALGTILGAFLAGFVLVPVLGLHTTILFGVVLNLLVAVAVLAVALPKRAAILPAAMVIVVAVLGVLLVPRSDPVLLSSGAYLYADKFAKGIRSGHDLRRYMAAQYEILFYQEGLTATVTVRENLEGERSLLVNGKADASDGGDMPTQVLSGHIVTLLHPQPVDIAVIGLASGVTLNAVAQHPTVRSIDCIEIASEMIEASSYFEHVNGAILDDPRVNLIIQDGRNHLKLTDRDYDLIVSEPSNPWMAGIASLYTRDFYRECSSRLRPNGVMGAFLHLYSLDLKTFRNIVRTFSEAFPYVTLWETIFASDYLLVGSNTPLDVRWEQLQERMQQPDVAEDLRRVGVFEPSDLLIHYLAGPDELRAFSADGTAYDDNRNRLEFEAPRLIYRSTTLSELSALQNLRQAGLPNWLREPIDTDDRQFARVAEVQLAYQEFVNGVVSNMRGNHVAATEKLTSALAQAPRLRAIRKFLLDSSKQVAEQSLANGDPASAIALFSEILNYTEDAEFYAQRAFVLAQSGRLAEAEADYRRATELAPKNIHYRFNLALSLARQQRYEESEVVFRDVVRRRPRHGIAYIQLGHIALQTGDLTAAEQHYRSAITIDPESAVAWSALGDVLWRRREYRQAADVLEKAIDRDATQQRARELLVDSYRQLGDTDRAARAATSRDGR